jgi:glycosyltransferase involved in cell wall biosynthesis
MDRPPRSLVVNFNAPELGYLALGLVRAGLLERYVRPYGNKGRLWERTLASLPLAGTAYASTFGRRRIDDPRVAALTSERGVAADFGAALVARLGVLPAEFRRHAAYDLQERVRDRVARAAVRFVADVGAVVAYVGFGLPAFERMRAQGRSGAVVNYPIAHHRYHRALQREEHEREPAFAATWPRLDEWPAAYEEQIDCEIAVADRILVGSSYVRDSFAREGVDARKIAVVPYGVDLATFTPGTPRSARGRKTFEVVFAGQLSQRKGISYLLRAYRRFHRADTRLTLVGNTPGSDEPLRPFADVIRRIPHQTRPALAETYRASDVFVLPTLLEGMPLVVLEAMACGLPVIVTANGPGDLVRDGVDGFVIPGRDEDAICDRLERLYRDPELRAEMGRSARARAREFTWGVYADRVIDVLRRIPEPALETHSPAATDDHPIDARA